MSDSTIVRLRHTGIYSLIASASLAAEASFVGMPRTAEEGGALVVDLAFPMDGSWETVGVRVTQDHRHEVRARIVGVHTGGDAHELAPERIRDEVERILALDHDGAAFARLGEGDRVVGELQTRFAGVRPVLYPSPYEAAARAIIMHRISRRQAAAVTDRISHEYGDAVDFGDHVVHAFPAPHRLAELTFVRGISARKVQQLAALGRAASDNRFNRERLRGMDRDAAATHLQQLPGIGPFSADLIMIRGMGDPDVFPLTEKSLHRAMAAAYDLGDEPELEALERIADRWRPFRSWVGLLFRHLVE